MTRNNPTFARLLPADGGLALESSYDPGLVAELKARIPPAERKWNNDRKAWIVASKHGATVARIVESFLGLSVAVPEIGTVTTAPQFRAVTLEYIGACKPRDDGSVSAFGYADAAWSVIVPEATLKAYFRETADAAPDAPATYYGLLGISQQAGEEEIKRAYKRMARQWHPDVCREPDAADRFRAINGAYNILIDPLLRRKYNAGLYFEAAVEQRTTRRVVVSTHYRAPLRCGLLLVEATPIIGRWLVSKIHRWDDITDQQGRILVTSWDVDAQEIIRTWVTP